MTEYWVTAFVLVMLLTSSKVCVSADVASPIGPIDINRREGENNVVIMCPTFQPVAPIWRINNHTYGASSLPSPFYPAYDNLLIPNVLLAMEKFKFQCFIPTGVGHEVVPSSVGVLTVDSRNSVQDGNVVKVTEATLTLDHWHLHFYSKNLTLSWKYSYNSSLGSSKLCSFSDATFHIQGWQCLDNIRSMSIWQYVRTNKTEISIPNTNLTHNNNSVFINMTVTSMIDPNMVCASLFYQFQVGRDVLTKIVHAAIGEDICISAPPTATNAVWPKSPTRKDIDNDCECPICDTPECNIKLCKCFPETSYNITLQSDDSMNYNLCVHDVQHIMNGMYIQLYQDRSSCLSAVSNVPLPPVYRLYVASYRIDVELPGPPILTVWQDSVCFESVSPPEFPVQHYELSVSDVTGEQRVFQNISAAVNCTTLGSLFDSIVCSPFNVSVRAFNKNGHSRTTSMITGNETGHNICDCIGTTVEVRANILLFDENSVKIQVDCNYTVISVDGVNLTISINKSGSQLTLNKSLLCREDKSNTIIFNNLLRNTKYYIFALWTGNLYEKSRQCMLSMPFVEFKTLANSQGTHKLAEILGPIIGFVIISLAIIVIVVVCHRFKKNNVKRCKQGTSQEKINYAAPGTEYAALSNN